MRGRKQSARLVVTMETRRSPGKALVSRYIFNLFLLIATWSVWRARGQAENITEKISEILRVSKTRVYFTAWYRGINSPEFCRENQSQVSREYAEQSANRDVSLILWIESASYIRYSSCWSMCIGCGEDSDKPVSRTLRSFVKNNLASLLLSMIVYVQDDDARFIKNQKFRSLIRFTFFPWKNCIFSIKSICISISVALITIYWDLIERDSRETWIVEK